MRNRQEWFNEKMAAVSPVIVSEVQLSADIIARLDAILKQKNMTQKDLARKMGRSEAACSWKEETYRPSSTATTTTATTLGECFHNCSSLVSINSPINVSSLTSQMDSTFTGCANLEVLTFTGTLRVDTWLSGAPKLTVVSLLSIIDSLTDLTGTGVSKKITFGARNKAKLTAAQLALVTDKGWTIG